MPYGSYPGKSIWCVFCWLGKHKWVIANHYKETNIIRYGCKRCGAAKYIIGKEK